MSKFRIKHPVEFEIGKFLAPHSYWLKNCPHGAFVLDDDHVLKAGTARVSWEQAILATEYGWTITSLFAVQAPNHVFALCTSPEVK